MKNLKQFSLDPILVMVLFSIIPEDKKNTNISASLKEKTCIDEHDISAVIVTNGAWETRSYWKSEPNEMINFDEFNFTFGDNDVLTVTDGTSLYKGTWAILETDSNNKNLSDLKFYITFGKSIHFVEIIDGWENIKKSCDYCELRDRSFKNSIYDLLTFSKN
jgi:hypothetical protein